MAPYQPYIDLKSSPAYRVYERNDSSSSTPSPNEETSGSTSSSSSSDNSSPRVSSENGDYISRKKNRSRSPSSHFQNDLVPPPPLYTPKLPSSRSPRRSQPATLLGAIDENGGMAPDIPARSDRRIHGAGAMAHKAFWSSLFFSPGSNGHNFFKISPPENEYDKVVGPRGEKLADARANRHLGKRKGIIRRNGWKAWVCIGLAVVIIVAVVAIGIVVGLKRSHHNNNNIEDDGNSSPSTGVPPGLTVFPAGTWTVTTFLSTIATLCTPNTATWRCYPYQTYNQSQSGAQTMLSWYINGTNSSSGQISYTIQSSANPFALPFASTPLKLVDSGTDNEAWSFEVLTTKLVVPDAAITSDGSSAECLYNSTSLSAKLYTKRPMTYPQSLGVNYTVDNNANGGNWPYAVELEQLSSEPPTCYRTNNGVRGAVVDLDVNENARYGACECVYMNYGT